MQSDEVHPPKNDLGISDPGMPIPAANLCTVGIDRKEALSSDFANNMTINRNYWEESRPSRSSRRIGHTGTARRMDLRDDLLAGKATAASSSLRAEFGNPR